MLKKSTFFKPVLGYKQYSLREKKEPMFILKINGVLLSKKLAKFAISWLDMLKKGNFYSIIAVFQFWVIFKFKYQKVT